MDTLRRITQDDQSVHVYPSTLAQRIIALPKIEQNNRHRVDLHLENVETFRIAHPMLRNPS